MSWINPITDLDIMMQHGNMTYYDLEAVGLPAKNQEDLKTVVETITTSITNKVDASEEFTPVEREFLRALMANVADNGLGEFLRALMANAADNGLEDGNEYKQLPQPKSLPQLCKEYETVALDLSKPQQNVQTYSPIEMIEQILGMDAPARTRLVLLGRILECNSELARAYAKQFDQLRTEEAVQATTTNQ